MKSVWVLAIAEIKDSLIVTDVELFTDEVLALRVLIDLNDRQVKGDRIGFVLKEVALTTKERKDDR